MFVRGSKQYKLDCGRPSQDGTRREHTFSGWFQNIPVGEYSRKRLTDGEGAQVEVSGFASDYKFRVLLLYFSGTDLALTAPQPRTNNSDVSRLNSATRVCGHHP